MKRAVVFFLTAWAINSSAADLFVGNVGQEASSVTLNSTRIEVKKGEAPKLIINYDNTHCAFSAKSLKDAVELEKQLKVREAKITLGERVLTQNPSEAPYKNSTVCAKVTLL